MPRLQRFVLYLAIPFLLAVTSGIRGQIPDKSLSVFFWVIHGLPSFIFDGVGSYLLYKLLRPWKPALPFIVVPGAVIGSIFSFVYTRAIFVLTGPLFQGINDPARYPAPGFTMPFLTFYLEMFAGGILIWTALNYYYDRVLGYPRYRYGAIVRLAGGAASQHERTGDVASPALADPAMTHKTRAPAMGTYAAAPIFMTRLPSNIGSELIAIEAQEHYIRVYTTLGSAMVLYRFQNAVSELRGMAGLRVHRSFWVMRKAIVAVRPRGKGCAIELVNGLQIPVSQTYKGSLEGLDLPTNAMATASF